MERKKASDFPQEILDLFDLYIHGDINRRGFLESAGKIVGGVTAAAMLESLTPNYALAQQVAKDDKRIKAEYMTYSSPQGSGTMKGYMAHPSDAKGKVAAVLVVHENRGLNPYIEDVARRLGVAGYMAFAPDALTPLGGYPGDETQATALFGKLDQKKTIEDFVAAATWLKSRPECSGKLGVVGFCYGGGIANTLAVRMGSDLAAAVPFYGQQPSAEDAAKIKAPLCLHYAGLDTRITGGWAAYKTALDAAHVKYEVYVYDNANHGFHNDTTPRYDEAAAKLAWQRTLDFFNKNLKG